MNLFEEVSGTPSSADSFLGDLRVALSTSSLWSASSWCILNTPSLEKFAFPSHKCLLWWRFFSDCWKSFHISLFDFPA